MGTYVTLDSGKTIVSISDENGKKYRFDVYSPLKDMSDYKTFTNKFISGINSKIENCEFEVNEGESISENLNKILKKALES